MRRRRGRGHRSYTFNQIIELHSESFLIAVSDMARTENIVPFICREYFFSRT